MTICPAKQKNTMIVKTVRQMHKGKHLSRDKKKKVS